MGNNANKGDPGHHRGQPTVGGPGRRSAGPACDYGSTDLADMQATPAAQDTRAPALAIHAELPTATQSIDKPGEAGSDSRAPGLAIHAAF